jgi:hypothetical protein
VFCVAQSFWATQNNIQKSKDWVTQNTIQKSKDWATQPNKKNGGKHVFQNGSQVPAPPLEAPFNVEILPFMCFYPFNLHCT